MLVEIVGYVENRGNASATFTYDGASVPVAAHQRTTPTLSYHRVRQPLPANVVFVKTAENVLPVDPHVALDRGDELRVRRANGSDDRVLMDELIAYIQTRFGWAAQGPKGDRGEKGDNPDSFTIDDVEGLADALAGRIAFNIVRFANELRMYQWRADGSDRAILEIGATTPDGQTLPALMVDPRQNMGIAGYTEHRGAIRALLIPFGVAPTGAPAEGYIMWATEEGGVFVRGPQGTTSKIALP